MKQYKVNVKENKKQLVGIIKDINKMKNTNHKKVEKILRKHPSKDGLFSKSSVISAYEKLKDELDFSEKEEKAFYRKVRMKKTRTISGVTPVTVLTKPFPCPGKCIFCPNDVRMPKSYLSDEPGAQRAETNRFDPYLQTHNRLAALKNIGHPIGKAELIILGGTWSSYPESYQIWFVKRCFDAMNDFFETSQDIIKPKQGQPYDEKKLEDVKGEDMKKSYNQVISLALKRQQEKDEKADWKELYKAQKENEKAKVKCVGLVIETRPDEINEKEIIRIRKLGSTKVQIGIQSLNDEVLRKNKRGHDVAQTKKALEMLRNAGFKIHAHWMPNLYGSSPEKDIKDYKKLFSEIHFKPDEIKVYPCSLIESAELMKYYKKELWKPYSQEELLKVLVETYKLTPEYCRITRMIRDIPSTDIVTGNQKTNFRQIAEKEVRKRGIKPKEIRWREIKDKKVAKKDLNLKITKYKTGNSTEYFLQYVTSPPRCPEDEERDRRISSKENKIAGFLRLSIPKNPENNIFDELKNTAIIREVHVYGQSVSTGKNSKGRAQHKGLGKSLIKKAEEISKEEGFKKVSVISSIGTRGYYKKRGFKQKGLYQVKGLN